MVTVADEDTYRERLHSSHCVLSTGYITPVTPTILQWSRFNIGPILQEKLLSKGLTARKQQAEIQIQAIWSKSP